MDRQQLINEEEREFLPSRPVLSPEQELAALTKEKQDFILHGRHSEWPAAKEARRQQIMKGFRSKPEVNVMTALPVFDGHPRGDRVIKTGFEKG